MELFRKTRPDAPAGQPGHQPPQGPLSEDSGPQTRSTRWHQRATWRLLIVVAVLALFAVWRAGTLDHALVNIGLNAKSCARNGFGATFCGSELEEYRARIQRAKTEGEAAQTKIEQLQHQSEEDNQRSQELVKRSQEEATAAGQRSQELAKRGEEEAAAAQRNGAP
jgi:Skp family chaperone for outer membrane proteins